MMELWSDYEGKTIAGAYPLERLIRPEGRSAFFTTHNGTGTPSVIRLIESINDEWEIFQRWKTVAEMKEEHLVTLRKFGHDKLDETHLLYLVMEPTDQTLEDVLRDRALTVAETREVAVAIIAALQALHGRGLVHEHVETANVLAVGEVVKLRSDCIREFPEGVEGPAARAKDVHDLAMVLLECLTLSRDPQPGVVLALPAPFADVVKNGLSGAWGLEQIAKVLVPPAPPKPVEPVKVEAPKVEEPKIAGGAEVKVGVAAVSTAAPVETAAKKEEKVVAKAAGEAAVSTKAAGWTPPGISVAAVEGSGIRANAGVAPLVQERLKFEEPRLSQRRAGLKDLPNRQLGGVIERIPRKMWVLGAAALGLVLLLALAIWMFSGHGDEKQAAVTPAGVPAATVAAPAVIAKPSTVAKPSAIPGQHGEWRVVVLTYNLREGAERRVASIESKHPGLKPEVFTPNGKAPYLVTMGGWMTVDQANAMRENVKKQGISRDAYVHNYKQR